MAISLFKIYLAIQDKLQKANIVFQYWDMTFKWNDTHSPYFGRSGHNLCFTQGIHAKFCVITCLFSQAQLQLASWLTDSIRTYAAEPSPTKYQLYIYAMYTANIHICNIGISRPGYQYHSHFWYWQIKGGHSITYQAWRGEYKLQ